MTREQVVSRIQRMHNNANIAATAIAALVADVEAFGDPGIANDAATLRRAAEALRVLADKARKVLDKM